MSTQDKATEGLRTLDRTGIDLLALQIVGMLHGVSVLQARVVIITAREFIEASAPVDADAPHLSEARTYLEARAHDSAEQG